MLKHTCSKRPRPRRRATLSRLPPWYQPGNSRCTYKTCTFRGSPQTVETHMMDRHLIYPPGWEKRKKKPEWDADPSLKGWTTVVLDSPEELAAWIAERKRRWPSATRIEEKKRKMEEAVARGQLSLEDSGLAGRKRRRVDDGGGQSGRGGERGRGRGAARANSRGRGTRVPPPQPPHLSPRSDFEFQRRRWCPRNPIFQATTRPLGRAYSVLPREVKSRPRPPQPKQPIRNNFASRPTLLRNLLLPEIRITVSNLSQAIRFLVDNDFLQNVELRPGQSGEKLIEVLREDITTK
ncbi:hypothetical protein FB451DRAFT_1336429 [Mycena latifolia]|nr:hypothetical protein FB451DRAFT_1336429 [Mycena latifolia]